MKKTFNIKNSDNRSDYILEFDKIAKIILNKSILKTIKNSYLIREIEFYYYT